MPTPKCPFTPATAQSVGSRSFLLIAVLVLAFGCTPKDRRNRMTWVKPGNGYVLKDPALAAKLKNLPTEIVDSGSRFSMWQSVVDYFACDVYTSCSKSFKKGHGNRLGIVGQAIFEISPFEAGPVDEAKSKLGIIQGKLKSKYDIREVSIAQIYIVYSDLVYIPSPDKQRLRVEDSLEDDGLGLIRIKTPIGPLWDSSNSKEKVYIIIEFSVGGRRHLLRSIPLVIL